MTWLPAVPRDRVAAMVIVATLAGAAWVYLGKMIWEMGVMPTSGGMMTAPTGPAYFAWLFAMWTVMMAAMMLPSAAPMTWMFSDFASGRHRQPATRLVFAFVLGYIACWGAFSLVAAFAQWLLVRAGLVSPMTMALTHELVAGAVLIAAGLYQWMPLKRACLRKCRTPLGFLMTEWREGMDGALVMGWRHGLWCVGCCWALMALLFVAGVMNPLWIVILAIFVTLEKVMRHGEIIARVAGAGLVIGGAFLAFS